MTMRRLTIIFAADVVGFSSLMGRDAEGTLANMKRKHPGSFCWSAVSSAERWCAVLASTCSKRCSNTADPPEVRSATLLVALAASSRIRTIVSG
jgi:hypothetical protein